MKLKQIAKTHSKKQILKSVENNLQVRARINEVVKTHIRDSNKVVQFLIAELAARAPEFTIPENVAAFSEELRQSAISGRDVI